MADPPATTYGLPGLRLTVRGEPAELRAALERPFELHERSTAPPDVVVEGVALSAPEALRRLPAWLRAAFDADRVAREPTWIADPEGREMGGRDPGGRDPGGREMGGVAAAWRGEHVAAWASADGRSIRFVAAMQSGARTTAMVLPVLVPILRDLYLERGRLLLHAAALRLPDGTGILLLGPSGGGKTTTSLALARRGAMIVADDIVVVDPGATERPGGIRVGGILKRLNVTDDTVGFFEELGRVPAASWRRELSWKLSVAPQDVYGPGCRADDCGVGLLGFLRREGDEPSGAPLSAAAALERLLGAHSFARSQPIGPRSVVALRGLLSDLPLLEVRTGASPDSLAEWILRHAPERARPGGASDLRSIP